VRAHCHRCRKPQAVCVCVELPRLANRTEVIILQHPREREHPFGTARFAELGLERVRTYVHYGLGRSPSPIETLPEGTAVIFPSEGARDLREVEPPPALLFLDGTWAQARTLHRINPVLATLQHLRITPRVQSRYQIRSEPEVDFTSTIEAIAEALAIVEPELEVDRLVAAFESMIARQIEYRRVPRPRVKKPRPKPKSRAVPEVLFEDRRIILAHCEVSRGELVYLAATDLSGTSFECFARPRRPAEDWWLDRAGLDRTSLDRGVGAAELAARWREFADDEDVLVCWNQSTLDDILTFVGHPTRRAVLKSAYCNLRSARAGTLEEVVRREGLSPVPLPVTGRTGQLLSLLIPVARWVLER
jgi:DTW domain-containing protein YfiP